MMQLNALLFILIGLFGVIGYQRGFNKEVISLAAIVLALFTLNSFDDLLRLTLLGNTPTQTRFIVQALIFAVIVFFGYQTRALIGGDAKAAQSVANRRYDDGGRLGGSGRRPDDGRDELQSRILGALMGLLNGYLVWGSLWYLMHINDYPLAPFIRAPALGSDSASLVSALPLYLLAGGPGGVDPLLSALVIVAFLIVLILI
ncbi:MAG: CvpA family protein [Chloroflexi bacterium]|nr:CvpA family protein [Chloroflexota bacterium]